MNRNKCDGCKFHKHIYRQCRYRYFRDSLFYCEKKEELLEEFCGCENRQTERNEYDFSEKRFEQVTNDVLRIEELLNI